MADIEELAGRVEGLTGPDREVDAAIHAYLAAAADWAGFPDWITPDNSPAYTASIDAAMTLATDRFPNAIMHEAMGRLADKFALHMAMWPGNESYAEWLARFVTAAALRSRTQGNQNGLEVRARLLSSGGEG